jgi:transaldolase/glucose-6-phosphate isomerase
MNPLVQLNALGQSPWFDYISRGMILSGALQAMIENDGLMGITSNPSIFEKSIGSSADYTPALKQLADRPINVKQIYEMLAVRDIQDAADLLYPVYARTAGRDGYVSLEVSPDLADCTQESIDEAIRLHHAVGRDNVMIKVPATPEGIPAIEALIGRGININVTLLFCVERYAEVAWAYIAGLERRAAAGGEIRRIASVASFFVSRIDTCVDNRLSALANATTDALRQTLLQSLMGKAAIANAKMAYLQFQEIFSHPRFLALAAQGAQVQRLLWGSTGTKNPNYPDTYYVETLIAKDTVNTLPVATFNAFRDHGQVKDSLLSGLDEARESLRLLAECGINLRAITDELLQDGVRLFSDAFTQLLRTLSEKRRNILGGRLNRQTYEDASVQTRLAQLQQERFVPRLWAEDVTLWPHEAADTIRQGLGWLHAPDWTAEQLARMTALATSIHSDGFTHILLMGMGGSSLCPLVLREMFGVLPGKPVLHVLDSTLPAEVRRVEAAIDPDRTLYILASKSGTTLEVMAFYRYFFDRMRQRMGDRAGERFIAITDAGSPLSRLAQEHRFRDILPGTPNIGGRYSALSWFGIAPAALMGLDAERLLERARILRYACAPAVPPDQNPCLVLGVILGEMARRGRDKITFLASPSARPLGLWLEQLIAESTGKNGRGIIPIHDEPVGPPAVYARDRLFVHLRDAADADEVLDQQVSALQKAGHPVVRMGLSDRMNIGQEFFRWEMATAIAGGLLGVNPFDQPHVEESKAHTRNILRGGALPEDAPLLIEDGIRIDADMENRTALAGQKGMREILEAHLARCSSGDYVAILAYLPQIAHPALQTIRRLIRDRKRVATTLGDGPRFLHSTGQLHKGGPNTGLFIQITAEIGEDLAIPSETSGEVYTFGMLTEAQARGDAIALSQRHRRLIRIHLGADVPAGLSRLQQALQQALEETLGSGRV